MPFLDEVPNETAPASLPQGAKPTPKALSLDEVNAISDMREVSTKDFDISSLAFSQIEAEDLRAKGRIGVFEQWNRTSKLEKIPFAGMGSSVHDAWTFHTSYDRLRKDEYTDEGLRAQDIEVVKKSLRYAAEEQIRGVSIAGRIADGVTSMPAYAVEFMASLAAGAPGGAAIARGVAQAGVKKISQEALKKAILTGVEWGGSAAIGATLVQSPRIFGKTLDNERQMNLMPTDKGFELTKQVQSAPVSSFLKAWGDTVIDQFSEEAGGYVFSPALKSVGASKFLKPVMDKMTGLFKKLHPNEAVSNLFKKGRWDGFISEIGEEVLADEIKSVTNVFDYDSKDGDTFLDKVYAAIPKGDNLAVLMGTLAVPGVVKAGASAAIHGGAEALYSYQQAKKDKRLEPEQADVEKAFGKGAKWEDIVASVTEEAIAPLPQMELTQEEIASLTVANRSGLAKFEKSKPIPERQLPPEIVNSKEFQEGDETRKLELLTSGRLKNISDQRDVVSDEIDRLETELKGLRKTGTGRREKVGQKTDRIRSTSELVIEDLGRLLEQKVQLKDLRSVIKNTKQSLKDEVSPDMRSQLSDMLVAAQEELDYRKRTKTSEAVFNAVTKEKLRGLISSSRVLLSEIEKTEGAQKEAESKTVWGKQEQLVTLTKQLVLLNQEADFLVADTAETLAEEDVTVKGKSLSGLTKKAREVGARMEQARVTAVIRNKQASAEERRTALVRYLQARLPGKDDANVRGKYAAAAKGVTEKQLQDIFEDIEGIRNTVMAKQLKARANELVEKMKPVIEEGVKKGRFKNTNISAMAQEVIEAVSRSAKEVEQTIAETVRAIERNIDMGEGESAQTELLRYRAMINYIVGGIEQRSVDQLEDAIRALTKQLALFRTGRDQVVVLKDAQRKAFKASLLAAVAKPRKRETLPQKVMSAVKSGIENTFAYSALPLAGLVKNLSGTAGAWDRMLVNPLEEISRRKAALRMYMERPFRQAMERIYKPKGETKWNYTKFLLSKMQIQPTDDPESKPFLRTVALNNGKMKKFVLSRWDVLYKYAVCYQEPGIVDPLAMETMTNENQVASIRRQVGMDQAFPDEASKEAEIARRISEGVRGNAIPSDILDTMFDDLTENDKKFSMETRRIFTSFWPLINPVYSRATGIDMTQIDSYMPWIKKPGQQQLAEEMITWGAMIEAHTTPFPSSTKERVSTSRAAFAEVGLPEVFHNFTNSMSHWIATHDITSRMQWLLKDGDIREAINAATDGVYNERDGRWENGSYIKWMDYHLKGIVSQGRTDAVTEAPFMGVIRRNISRANLADVKQAPLQLSSALAAIASVGHRSFASGLVSFFKDPGAAISLMERAPSLDNRYQNILIDMREVQDQLLRQKGKWYDRLLPDHYVFFATQLGDRAAIYVGGWTVFKEAYDRTKDLKKAYDAFDTFVLTLQQSSLREQQAAILTGPYRMMFQFLSSPSQYTRVVYEAWADMIKKPDAKSMQKWARVMAVMFVYLPTARAAVASAFLPPADDEDAEDKRRARLLADVISGPFGGLWILGHLVSLAAGMITGETGFPIEPPTFSVMDKTKQQLSDAIRKSMDEDAEFEEIIDAFIKAGKSTVGLTAGIPNEIVDIADGLMKYSAGDFTAQDIPGLFYGHSVSLMELERGIQ